MSAPSTRRAFRRYCKQWSSSSPKPGTKTSLSSESCVEVYPTAPRASWPQTAWALGDNERVQNGDCSLTELLSQMGFHFGTYLWDPQYKGLDDYIWQAATTATAPNRAQ